MAVVFVAAAAVVELCKGPSMIQLGGSIEELFSTTTTKPPSGFSIRGLVYSLVGGVDPLYHSFLFCGARRQNQPFRFFYFVFFFSCRCRSDDIGGI